MSESTAEVESQPTVEEDPLLELDRLEANDGARERAAEQGVTLPPDTPSPESGIAPAQETPAEEAARLFAGKFKSEEELEKGYTNLEAELGRMRGEIGETRAQLRAYEQTYQPPQGQQPEGQGELPELTQEQLEQMVMENPIAAIDYVSTMRALEIVQMAMGQMEQQLEPITKTVNRQASREALDALTEMYGAELVLRNKERVAEMVSADEQYFLAPETRQQRLQMALAAAEFERSRDEERRSAPGQPQAVNGALPAGVGSVHVEGGSTPPQPGREQEGDPILREMDEVAEERDAFGLRPGVWSRTPR